MARFGRVKQLPCSAETDIKFQWEVAVHKTLLVFSDTPGAKIVSWLAGKSENTLNGQLATLGRWAAICIALVRAFFGWEKQNE